MERMNKTRRILAAPLLAACVFTTGPALAWDAGYFSYMADSHMHNMMLREIAKRDQIARQLKSGQGRGAPQAAATLAAAPAAATATTITPSASPSFPAQLASTYPPASRAQAERTFRELLVAYGKIEDQFGLQHGDVAGSLAAFIAGNHMAYRNAPFPDDTFKAMVGQMRQVLATNPGFQGASTAQKQELYEQMALVGMLMATGQMALQKQPNPQAAENMRKAAKSYLEQFLKTDADRIQLTSAGMVIR